jgi:hypothetical protein
MKLPRWLMTGMLCSSVLAVFVAAARWWVATPEWTARTFADKVAAEEFDAAKAMCSELLQAFDEDQSKAALLGWAAEFTDTAWVRDNLRGERRRLVDVLRRRQAFRTTRPAAADEEALTVWPLIEGATVTDLRLAPR